MNNGTYDRLKQQGEWDRQNSRPPNPNIPDSQRAPYQKGYTGQS